MFDLMNTEVINAEAIEDMLVAGFLGREDYEDEDRGEEEYVASLSFLGRAAAALRDEDVLTGNEGHDYVMKHWVAAYAKETGISESDAQESWCLWDEIPAATPKVLRRIARADARRDVLRNKQMSKFFAATQSLEEEGKDLSEANIKSRMAKIS